jgi:hypothetical protein
LSDDLKTLQSIAKSMDNPVIQWAAAEITRLREERRWVPVGERLPEEDEQVLWLLNDNATIDLDYTKPFNATHWKPKPLPPGPEGDGNG